MGFFTVNSCELFRSRHQIIIVWGAYVQTVPSIYLFVLSCFSVIQCSCLHVAFHVSARAYVSGTLPLGYIGPEFYAYQGSKHRLPMQGSAVYILEIVP
jgi:hypothetical protein